MLRRHFSSRLRVGRFLGIDLFIHWSFWILVVLVAGAEIFQGSWIDAGIAVLRIAALFVCVTLHEYGHAMMARRFGVQTVDITLLPIGGLARLERMPREPMQEFLVAIAGPMVNVVIASVAAVGLMISVYGTTFTTLAETIVHYLENPLGWLFFVNSILVIFNMIPAFPMDGGRVLRSLLATVLDYPLATRLAARCGLVVAIAMAGLGLFMHHAPMVLISAFIGYAGWAEARQVAVLESYRGIMVPTAMTQATELLHATDSLATMIDRFTRSGATWIPVLGVDRYFLGSIDLPTVLTAAHAGRWEMVASDLADSGAPSIEYPGPVARQLSSYGTINEPVAVLDPQGRFLGVLDLRFARLRSELAEHRANLVSSSDEEPIMAVLVEQSPQASSPGEAPPRWSGDQYA